MSTMVKNYVIYKIFFKVLILILNTKELFWFQLLLGLQKTIRHFLFEVKLLNLFFDHIAFTDHLLASLNI